MLLYSSSCQTEPFTRRAITKMRLFVASPALRLCTILVAILIPQAVALPASSRTVSLVPDGTKNSQPWFIRRRFTLVPVQQPPVNYPTPRNVHEIQILPQSNFNKRHSSLVRRNVFTGAQGVTIGAAIIVTVSVLIGVGIGAIAIFGFEWKKFCCGRSSVRSKKEDSEALVKPPLRNEPRQPTLPPIGIEEEAGGGGKNYR